MIPSHLDFRRLKRLVSIEQVLADRGLLGSLRRRRESLVGPCPLHHGHNPSAFVVHLSRNLWRCFTACDSGGDVVELVRRLDSASYRNVALYLASLASTGPPPPTPPPPRQPFRPFRYTLHLQPNVGFLQQKGISPSTALRFEAGAYAGRGFLEGCIGVRLHDPDGLPLGYAGRRLDPDQAFQFGKWKFPPRLPRNQLLYNLHRVRHHLPGPLLLTECPWSVMRLDQLHIPAVALLGVHLSLAQRQSLASVTRILLLFDDRPRRPRRRPANPNTTPANRRCADPDPARRSRPG